MKRRSIALVAFCISALIGVHPFVYAGELFQVSAFTPFEQGTYDGPVTFKELKQHGNQGIGTVNGLYGEMIALDGQFFQMRTDGKVYAIEDTEQTPFAMVTQFKADKKVPVADIKDAKELHRALDGILPDPGVTCAFRIAGNFKRLKVRSVPKQDKPFPKLEDVLKNQTVFELKDVKGTMVGFRFPDYMKGVNFPGYHFHFITADKAAGGHVLDCQIQQAEAEMEVVSSLNMKLIPADKDAKP
jgi:acetolactate decarboxylase